jgi:D-serine deaminase-like pyridoxal phosphate-dependent protein
MKTINITISLTEREHELLVAARCDRPGPERIKSFLLADAARTLRGMIDNVQQERNARTMQRFADKGIKLVIKRNTQTTKPNSLLVTKQHSDRSAVKLDV